jgi:cytidylate kinase
LGFAEMYLNELSEREIRTIEVSSFVSKVAEVSEVRAKLVEQQKEMGKEQRNCNGWKRYWYRSFPDAELKIFMTASASTEHKDDDELVAKGDVTFDEVLKNVEERDYIDTTMRFSISDGGRCN